MLYALHLYSDTCQLFLNKTRKKKIPASYFVDIDKPILKFLQRQKAKNRQYNIDGEQQSWRTDTMCLQDLV